MPRNLAHFLVALHGGSNVRGSFTGALKLARGVVLELEGYMKVMPATESESVKWREDEELGTGIAYLATPRGEA